jgi:predicted nucleic acid-binding protein
LFLLDTNVVSELRKASQCHPSVAQWQAQQRPDDCFLSVVTLLEIRLGIELARKNDRAKAEIFERWLEKRMITGFSGRVFPVDGAIAEICGRLHAERPRSFRDGLILATAVAHRLTVVTLNTKDFEDSGVVVINPWK